MGLELLYVCTAWVSTKEFGLSEQDDFQGRLKRADRLTVYYISQEMCHPVANSYWLIIHT